MSKGWIYILISPGLQKDLLKIGRTTQSPEGRAKELSSSTGVPAEFHVAYDVYVLDCLKAEKLIHEKLHNHRYVNNKEFFKISLKQAIRTVQEIADQVGVIEDEAADVGVIAVSEDTAPVEVKANSAFQANRDEYSGSRLMRRCGQLGIPYQKAIESPYAQRRGWKFGQFKIQYRDGVHGTTGWGADKRPMRESETTPHNYTEMLDLLGLPVTPESAAQ